MSAIAEYIKLLPKGIKNIKKIADGVVNQVKMEFDALPQEEVEIIAGRRLICRQCPYNSINATKLGLYTGDRTDEHCIHCGCPIATKTASLESNCGLEEFNEKHPDNQIPLKWVKIK